MKNINLHEIDAVYAAFAPEMSVERRIQYCIRLLEATENPLSESRRQRHPARNLRYIARCAKKELFRLSAMFNKID